jgi:hypothetical protein
MRHGCGRSRPAPRELRPAAASARWVLFAGFRNALQRRSDLCVRILVFICVRVTVA